MACVTVHLAGMRYPDGRHDSYRSKPMLSNCLHAPASQPPDPSMNSSVVYKRYRTATEYQPATQVWTRNSVLNIVGQDLSGDVLLLAVVDKGIIATLPSSDVMLLAFMNNYPGYGPCSEANQKRFSLPVVRDVLAQRVRSYQRSGGDADCTTAEISIFRGLRKLLARSHTGRTGVLVQVSRKGMSLSIWMSACCMKETRI